MEGVCGVSWTSTIGSWVWRLADGIFGGAGDPYCWLGKTNFNYLTSLPEILWQIQKGVNGARADDTKGVKGTIIDWITPKGQSLIPHIPRNEKSGCGFNHERTGALLCPAGLDWNNIEYVHAELPSRHSVTSTHRIKTKLMNGQMQVAGDQWPLFLYADYTYDPKDPWNGLLRSGLLVSVGLFIFFQSMAGWSQSHRPSNIYLLYLVRSTRNPRWCDPWTHVFTACTLLPSHRLHMSQLRYV